MAVPVDRPLSERELGRTGHLHRSTPRDRMRPPGFRPYAFAWVLADIQSLPVPVAYCHRPGTQGWATIDGVVGQHVESLLRVRQVAGRRPTSPRSVYLCPLKNNQ